MGNSIADKLTYRHGSQPLLMLFRRGILSGLPLLIRAWPLPKPPNSTASNKGAVLDERRAQLLGGYLSWLEARPLAARSRQTYGIRSAGISPGWGIARRSTAIRLRTATHVTGRCGITSGI